MVTTIGITLLLMGITAYLASLHKEDRAFESREEDFKEIQQMLRK